MNAAPRVDTPAPFASRLLAWFDTHGRKTLPWQHPRTPYRVWVSEIMLQQTQVATVIGYFDRFIARFPDLATLAAASLDDVLARWQGLGYYSRARNLHRAAQLAVERHGGELPRTLDELGALPGIGRSTAGAILAQAHGARVAILDGNVRRVLARHAAITAPVDAPATQRLLWGIAESHLPPARLADYTQAIMDLGATICVRRAPRCDACPVNDDCIARADGLTDELPRKRAARAVPTRYTVMLVVRDARGAVLLERRPPSGIWGGLHALPQCESIEAAHETLATRVGIDAGDATLLAPFVHVFTHFRLEVQPVLFTLARDVTHVRDGDALRWVSPAHYDDVGMPRPVRTLLDALSLPAASLDDDAPPATRRQRKPR